MTTIDFDSECIHGLGPVSACVICNGRAERERAAAAEVVHWFDARYDSRLGCGCYALIGEPIAKRADGTYVCADHERAP